MVFLDANKNTIQGPFKHMFSSPGLSMRDGHYKCHLDSQWKHTATFKKGASLSRSLIDAVFLSPDWPDGPNTWLAFSKSVADHRCNIMDVDLTGLLGNNLKRIVWPEARRLSCTIPAAKAKYVQIVERQARKHWLVERHYELGAAFEYGAASDAQKAKLEKLDQQKKEIMAYAEWNCWKF